MGKTSKNSITAALLIFIFIIGLTGCGDREKSIDGTSKKFLIESNVIEENSSNLKINLTLPVVSKFSVAKKVNSEIEKNIARAKPEVIAAAEELKKKGSASNAFLGSSYEYWQSGDIVSIVVAMENFTGGTHGYHWLETYNFNIEKNEIYTFDSLFKDDYKGAVYGKMEAVIKENSESYSADSMKKVKAYGGNLPFYIKNNKIIVYMPLDTIKIYTGGIPTFEFKTEEIKSILKPEIYDAIRLGK